MAGFNRYEQFRQRLPLTVVGMKSAEIGALVKFTIPGCIGRWPIMGFVQSDAL